MLFKVEKISEMGVKVKNHVYKLTYIASSSSTVKVVMYTSSPQSIQKDTPIS